MWSPELGNGTVFIGGTWRRADSGATFPSCNPATAEEIGPVSDAGAAETAAAIAASAAAEASWASTTHYERAAILLEAHRLMTERAEDLAVLMTTEQGKPLRAARNEVRYAADFLQWFGEEAKRVYGATIPSARGRPALHHHAPAGRRGRGDHARGTTRSP